MEKFVEEVARFTSRTYGELRLAKFDAVADGDVGEAAAFGQDQHGDLPSCSSTLHCLGSLCTGRGLQSFESSRISADCRPVAPVVRPVQLDHET